MPRSSRPKDSDDLAEEARHFRRPLQIVERGGADLRKQGRVSFITARVLLRGYRCSQVQQAADALGKALEIGRHALLPGMSDDAREESQQGGVPPGNIAAVEADQTDRGVAGDPLAEFIDGRYPVFQCPATSQPDQQTIASGWV